MRLCSVIISVSAFICANLYASLPENLSSKASFTASGRFSNDYFARYIADNVIPKPNSRYDKKQAWCLPQEKSKNARLTFHWRNDVEIRSIVYWGRTAFSDNENFSQCMVYIDDQPEPVITAKLEKGPQGQIIILPQKVTTRKLNLVFPTNYGGANPGASEIAVFSEVLTEKQISEFQNGPNEFNAELSAKLKKGELGFEKFLVVQRYPLNPTHVYTYHQEGIRPGGGLWIVDITGEEISRKKILDSSKGEILDANIHYDGKTILFSWKRTMDDFFQLYTINVDGTGLKQLTDHESNNFNASFLPDGGIVFLSDRKPAFAYCWSTTTPILWRCNSDGSNPIRLSANYLNDFTPAVLSTGKVIFSRWEYVDRPAIPIQSLWTINPDGTRLEGYFGNRSLSPATFMDAREIPNSKGKVICVLTAHNGPCRGAIGIIDPSKGGNAQDAITNLTPEINIGRVDKGSGNRVRGPYLNPYPIDENYYFVSKAGQIQLRDYNQTVSYSIMDAQKDGGFYNPQPIRKRKLEKLVASSADPGLKADDGNWATIIMQDVYNGLGNAVKPGEIKKLAIVQEIEKPVGVDPALRAFGFQFPVVSCGATYAPKKIWGYADVEKDGSANFKVPALEPIYFLPLDEKGMAVQRMRTFTHLMPGEVQSCIGCHADRNYAMPKTTDKKMRRPIAMLRETQQLEKPEWGVHGFSYPHIVQPVLDKHCVKCHDYDNPPAGLELTGGKTDFFNVSYENLARKGTSVETRVMDGGTGGEFKYSKYTSWISTHNGQEENILEIEPGRWGAKASLLAKIIDTGHPDKEGNPRIDMSHDEKARIYAWIDLNCPYYGTSDSNHMELRGCRRQLPKNFINTMKDVASRRCVSCHENAAKDDEWVFKLKDNFYIRLDNPQRNNFLTAPLSKKAGGSQKCGKAVFTDKNDPDYQMIMDGFEKLQQKLEKRPRFDMLKLEDQKPRTECKDTDCQPKD